MTNEIINGQLLVQAEVYQEMKEGYIITAVNEGREIVSIWGTEGGTDTFTENIDNAKFYVDRKEARRQARDVEDNYIVPGHPDAEMEVKKALLAVQLTEETPILFTGNKPATEAKTEETETTIEGAEPKVE